MANGSSISAVSGFFERAGAACAPRSGRPLWLQGEDACWLITAGKVDVFLTAVRGGSTSALRPLFRVEAGQLLMGLPETAEGDDWGLAAIGSADCQVLQASRQALLRSAGHHVGIREELAPLLDAWLEHLVSPLPGIAPDSAVEIESGMACELAAGEAVLAHRGGVWLSDTSASAALDSGAAFLFRGRALAHLNPPLRQFPLPRLCWMQAASAAAPQAQSTAEILREAAPPAGLDVFHRILLACLVADAIAADSAERVRLQQKAVREGAHMRGAMQQLSAILGQSRLSAPDEPTDSPLLAACRLLGKVAGIRFRAPPQGLDESDPRRDLLGEIVETSRIRRRQVALKGDWWGRDGGHMLAFLEDGKKPVALLQTPTGYELHAPGEDAAQKVDAELAAALQPFAFVFYRTFGDAAGDLKAMLRFGSFGNMRDFLIVAAMGVSIGLLGMVTPTVTGMLFDTAIPSADRGQLAQLTLALIAGAFATGMFEVTRGYAMLRAEGKMDSAVQAAVWDRLLRLPVPFFRDYSAGDLAMRANGINVIRQALSGTTMHSLMSAVFSIFNLALLFYYSVDMAWVALGLVLVAILFTVGNGYARLRYERKLAEIEGRISGVVFQLLGGIAKLRTTGAEDRAFLNWATLFARQQGHQFRATMVNNALEVFNALFPTIANMVIFGFIAFYLVDDRDFSTGAFLAFSAAFGAFLGAMLGTTAALTAILGVVPIYERAKPILLTRQENAAGKGSPGKLSGEIEISHLSFSYSADGPQILNDISLRIEPGEFVAIVGSSGSGKSTLLRLLLGFEQPSSGSIYYDHKDLAGLDLGAVRRQLGVVLQNGQLLSGDIFTNIIGSAATLTIDDAWEAATQAGIAEDIRAMPMGMHTMVSDGGGGLSGGQRQRLLIARAIVNRPRIIYFDEATSALDNRAQEMVSASLEALRATRVVIAHRLSTIVNADRIFVLDKGQLVQTGTYDQLIAQEGLFGDLARRQIA